MYSHMSVFKSILERHKFIRSKNWLQSVYTDKYAFVGLGNHSISNLYPVLDYLHVSLKYICCKSVDKIPLIKHRWEHIQATTALEEILMDQEVEGIFVSVSPDAHFDMGRQVLASGKALFIEKPPCSSLTELQQLTDLERSFVVVGMQKRYAPATKLLEKRLKKETLLTYNMRYLTGGYPEGNALIDLFIHPLDYVCHLFGKAEISGCEYIQGKNGTTLLLSLRHKGITGILELSTAYSWSDAKETLTVNTERGIYDLKQMETLTFAPKQGYILGIPLEKVKRRNIVTEVLFSRNNFVPTIVNNQIYTQGYLDEIRTFVEAVQNRNLNSRSYGFSSMHNTYTLIESIKKRINYRN